MSFFQSTDPLVMVENASEAEKQSWVVLETSMVANISKACEVIGEDISVVPLVLKSTGVYIYTFSECSTMAVETFITGFNMERSRMPKNDIRVTLVLKDLAAVLWDAGNSIHNESKARIYYNPKVNYFVIESWALEVDPNNEKKQRWVKQTTYSVPLENLEISEPPDIHTKAVLYEVDLPLAKINNCFQRVGTYTTVRLDIGPDGILSYTAACGVRRKKTILALDAKYVGPNHLSPGFHYEYAPKSITFGGIKPSKIPGHTGTVALVFREDGLLQFRHYLTGIGSEFCVTIGPQKLEDDDEEQAPMQGQVATGHQQTVVVTTNDSGEPPAKRNHS